MRELTFDPDLFDDGFFAEAFVEDGDSDLAERIKDAVEALPEAERDVVECLMWGQMTKTATAELLGRPRQSVHDAWLRAVDTLREALRDAV